MKGKLVPFFVINKSKLTFLGFAASALSGGYFLSSRTDVVRNTFEFIENTVINPISSYVSDLFVSGMDQMRNGFINLGSMWGNWFFFIGENVDIQWDQKGDFFTLFLEGNKRLLVSVKNVFCELSRFIFVSLPEFVRKHNVDEIVDYVKHYLRPLKMLFVRPELDRLTSLKTRFDQFVDAFKNPLFFDTLRSMSSFFIRFKDQIDQLKDVQLAELIDVYFDDPVDMKNKVDLVIQHVGNDEEMLRKNFDVQLMMDFVRSENVDKIRAKLAASKISFGISKFKSIFSWTAADDSVEENKQLNESIEKAFVGIVS